MTDKSPPDRNVAYTVRMTADESAALERIRIAMGARSHAEVVRRLIGGADRASGARAVPLQDLVNTSYLKAGDFFSAVRLPEYKDPDQ